MGHAIMAWMGGRWALPLGAIVPTAAMTLIGETRSYFFIFLFYGLLFFALFYFYREKYYFYFRSIILLFCLSFYLTFRVDELQLSSYIYGAGILGEIFLSTLIVISFYYKISDRFRWDFWRYPFLIYGAVGFTNSALQWYRIKNNLQEMPMGSAISTDGAKDMSGDLNRLLLAGWSEAQIIAFYWFCIKVGLIIIGLHYAINLLAEEKTNNQQDKT